MLMCNFCRGVCCTALCPAVFSCAVCYVCCGQVNLNSVWSGMGLMENNLLGAQQETRLRVEELEDRWGGHSGCQLGFRVVLLAIALQQYIYVISQRAGHAVWHT